MALGICFVVKDYDTVRKLLDKAKTIYEGYYYAAGCYELAFRTNAGVDKEIEALERFLDIQEEESYMLRLSCRQTEIKKLVGSAKSLSDSLLMVRQLNMQKSFRMP